MKRMIYQVLPRLFGNTESTNKENGTLAENGSGKFESFTPKVLQSLRAMGYTSIWYTGVIEHATKEDFTPFGISIDPRDTIKGQAGSPYAIKDYYDVNPYLATQPEKRMKEFEALIKRSHKAGLEVIIDFVPNHVARCYHSDAKPKGVTDFGENDRTDWHFYNQNNFYYFPNEQLRGCFEGTEYKEIPAKATGNDCFNPHPSDNDWYETIKLNYGVDYCGGGRKEFDPIPDTWTKMIEILQFWAKKGVDGFRCDMAEMVPVEFWGYAISRLKEQHPNLLFIAEVYKPDLYRSYLSEGGFDYLYDKVGLYDTLRNIITGHEYASSITRCWQQVDGINHQMLNFLENHDEQRIASVYFANCVYKAFPAIAVSALMNDAPFMIYAGQEIGESGMDEEGFSGCDGRTSIFDFWSPDSLRRFYNQGAFNEELLSTHEKEVLHYYQKILKIATEEKAISQGLFHDLMYVNYGDEGVNPKWIYCFLRKAEDETILVVCNFAPNDKSVKIKIPGFILRQLGIEPEAHASFTDLVTDEQYDLPLDGRTALPLSLKKHSALILKHTQPTKNSPSTEKNR